MKPNSEAVRSTCGKNLPTTLILAASLLHLFEGQPEKGDSPRGREVTKISCAPLFRIDRSKFDQHKKWPGWKLLNDMENMDGPWTVITHKTWQQLIRI